MSALHRSRNNGPASVIIGCALALIASGAQGNETATGRLEPAAVERVVQSHQAEVIDCYEPIARDRPDVEGRIVLQWTLRTDGRPLGAAILEDTLPDARVATCIVEAAAEWRFPPPTSVAVIVYPITLRLR